MLMFNRTTANQPDLLAGDKTTSIMWKKIIRTLCILCALLVVILITLTFSYRKPITIPVGLNGKHVLVDDVRLRVHQTGQGPDVLLLHGSIGSLEDFETVIPELSKRYRVTSFDRIGHGFSDMANNAANIALNAHYTHRLIKTLQLKDVIVVGHSYGGSIALNLAVDNIPDIKGYVLLAPAAYPMNNTRMLEHVLATDMVGLGLLRVLRPFLAEDMLRKGLLYSLTPNQHEVSADFVNFRLGLWNNTGILYTRTQQTAHVDNELQQMSTQYEHLNKPVVILLGKQEPHSDISSGCIQLSGLLPNAQLQLLDDTGHYIQYKQPAAVINAINRLH